MNRIEFYQMIGTGIRRYLPMGYQEYQVHIKEAEISEKKNALLVLEKEGVKNMPVMSLEPYLDRVEAGMARWYRYSTGVSTIRWCGKY